MSGSERIVARWDKAEKKNSRDVKLARSTGPADCLDTWNGTRFRDFEKESKMNPRFRVAGIKEWISFWTC